MRTVPPEAYTHKELAQAMTWREGQPEYVKAMTSSPDSLIGLYKKALRTHEAKGNIMSDSFKSNLKNLAEGLKGFEGEESFRSAPPVAPLADNGARFTENPGVELESMTNRASNGFMREGNITEGPSVSNSVNPSVEQPFLNSAGVPMPELAGQPNQPQPIKNQPDPQATSSAQLDDASMAMIREVRDQLNLGSDTEAIRALVKLGFSRIRPIFE